MYVHYRIDTIDTNKAVWILYRSSWYLEHSSIQLYTTTIDSHILFDQIMWSGHVI